MVNGIRTRFLMAVLLLAALLTVPVAAAAHSFFPQADRIGEPAGEPLVRAVFRGEELLGYLFETNDVSPIPAYSGLPVNMLVGLSVDGRITGVEVIEHHEPIMLVGIPESALDQFVGQYVDRSVRERIRVGRSRRSQENVVNVDAVSGATVTVVVMGEGIMRSAHEVAQAYGLTTGGSEQQAQVRDVFEPASWEQLLEMGAVGNMHLTRGAIDESFMGTPAADFDTSPAGREGETFIDFYYAYLNAPTIGQNLLGERRYNQLMARLAEGEHAIMLMGSGIYSYRGSGFVRGGIFDRIQLHQGNRSVSFRDTDYSRQVSLAAEGAPHLTEIGIFTVRAEHGFDPGQPWEIDLLVRRQYAALDTIFTTFNARYEIPDALVDRPAAAEAREFGALWVEVWYDKAFQIAVLGLGLTVLTFILLFQDWLTRHPTLVARLRVGFLIYTLFFIGWYSLAQLSVVNVLTFTGALMGNFNWETFLLDPMIFILWSFVAVTLLLWGRGVFCGWLCPFGALQELVNKVARKFKVRQYELPFAVHERLWALKYVILLGLFGVSLHSLGQAEVYAEVEPFKTAILMQFQREWGFVLYAGLLVLISAFTNKFYCRYVCPLGAALAVPARLRLFDWLKRHPNDCGQPCQVCANECEVQAIHPDGHINPNECHHCLDCQVTYWNDRKCPPMVKQRKRREKASGQGQSNGFPEIHVPAKTGTAEKLA